MTQSTSFFHPKETIAGKKRIKNVHQHMYMTRAFPNKVYLQYLAYVEEQLMKRINDIYIFPSNRNNLNINKWINKGLNIPYTSFSKKVSLAFMIENLPKIIYDTKYIIFQSNSNNFNKNE